MARPPKHILEKHDHQMTVRFTDIQYEYIVDNAKNRYLQTVDMLSII